VIVGGWLEPAFDLVVPVVVCSPWSTGRDWGAAAAWALLRAEVLKIAESTAEAARPPTEPPASRNPCE